MDLTKDTYLAVRDGELKDPDSLRQHSITTATDIDYITEPLSYDEFFRRFLLPNKPCVLGPWATEGWRSTKEWVRDDGTPNLLYLADKFGNATCPVARCDREEFDAHPKIEMTFAAYVDYLQSFEASRAKSTSSKTEPAKTEPAQTDEAGVPSEESTSSNLCAESQEKCSPEECLYLKDWHFQREFPAYTAYSVPPYFHSDWMNEFWDVRDDSRDDYRFVYIGPAGSWTPFHSDVFRSHSWSANICGRKKWIFYPPGEESKLRDTLGHLAFDLTSGTLEDRGRYPQGPEGLQAGITLYQNRGEVVFVPSGWHHQVFNLETTISINHNWMNGSNVDLSWRHLVTSMGDVKREIADCRDMDGWGAQCQLILKANAGMDYAEFYRYLETIAKRRFEALQNPPEHQNGVQNGVASSNGVPISDHDSNYGDPKLYHRLFDLIKIRNLVLEIKRNKEFLELDLSQFSLRPRALVNNIQEYLEKYDES